MKKVISAVMAFLCLLPLASCSFSVPVVSDVGESHLHDSLYNLFTLEWYEDACRFQDMVKKIAAAKPTDADTADYLLGYIDCDSNAQARYISTIYTGQKNLSKPVLPQQLNQPFADFFDAKERFQEHLKTALQKTRQLPSDSAFQENVQELVPLSDDLFVKIGDIQGGDGLAQFQKALESAAAYMDAAFPASAPASAELQTVENAEYSLLVPKAWDVQSATFSQSGQQTGGVETLRYDPTEALDAQSSLFGNHVSRVLS